MIWLSIVWQWIVRSMIGRVVAGAIVFVVAWSLNNAWQRKKGAEQIITQSIAKGKAANEQNAKIRAQVKAPGAAERVLRDFCRDC